MKKVIRIFNIFLMAIAAGAMIALAVYPTIRLDFGYHLSNEQISEMIGNQPSDSGEHAIDYRELLGEEGVNLNFSFEVKSRVLLKSFSKDARDVVEEEFIKPNVDNMVTSLRDPFRTVSRRTIKLMFVTYYKGYFEGEIEVAKQVVGDTRSNSEIRIAGGLTDEYLQEIGTRAYEKAGLGNSSVTGVADEMFDTTNDATRKFNAANTGVTLIELDEGGRDDVRNAIENMFDTMGMIEPDGESLYSFETVADAFLVDTLEHRSGNSGDEPEENIEEKAARLNDVLNGLIREMVPEESYNGLITGLKFAFIGLFIFEAVWGFYFIFTFVRTVFRKTKVYTFTGPIFWIIGLVQIVLGVGLTIVIAAVTKGNLLSSLPNGGSAAKTLANLTLELHTCTFIPSIIVLVMIPITIVYGVLKHKYKKQIKAEMKGAK